MNRDGRRSRSGTQALPSVWFDAGDGRKFSEVRFGDGLVRSTGIASGTSTRTAIRNIATARSEAPK